MSDHDLLITAYWVGGAFLVLLYFASLALFRTLDEIGESLAQDKKRKAAYTKALEDLTDPDKIQEDMERGADILEARQANRLMAPRPDAGPPARVHRPKFVGKRATFWNPPRP